MNSCYVRRLLCLKNSVLLQSATAIPQAATSKGCLSFKHGLAGPNQFRLMSAICTNKGQLGWQINHKNTHFLKPMAFNVRTASSSTPTEEEKLRAESTMRLINENGFLSWCRNAYISSVVGVGMISGPTSALAQTAGTAAFFVAFLNVFWGTGCHVNNLIRLRHVTGMSGIALFLNLCGSVLHACLWLAVLICYLGFLDGADKEDFDKEEKKTKPAEVAVDV